MIRFKHFLDESRALEKYTKTDDYGYYKGMVADEYVQLSSKYPFDGGNLYRGLNFSTPKQYLAFRRSIRDGFIKSDTISSWAPTQSTAKSFAVSPQVYVPTAAALSGYDPNERVSGFIGVVVVIQGRKGVGIDVRKSKHASEDEVILPAGSYKITNIIVEKKWKHIVHKLDINQEVIDIINGKKDVDRDLMLQLFRYKGGDLYPDVKKRIVANAVDSFLKHNFVSIDYTPEPINKWQDNIKEFNLLFPDGEYKFELRGNMGLLDFTTFDDIKDLITPNDMRRIKKYLVDKINSKTKMLSGKKVNISYNYSFHRLVATFNLGLNDFKYLASAYADTYNRFNALLRDYNRLRHFDVRNMTELLKQSMGGPFR